MGNYLSFYFTAFVVVVVVVQRLFSFTFTSTFLYFPGKKTLSYFPDMKNTFSLLHWAKQRDMCVLFIPLDCIKGNFYYLIFFFAQWYSVSSRDISVCFLANKIIRTTVSNDLRASKFLRWLKTLSTFPHSINSARVQISPESFSRVRRNVWKTGKRMRGEKQAEATAACSLVKQTEKSM